MPSALKFIGGGLLQGAGEGLAKAGKAKREAALEKLKDERAQKRALELEGVRQESRRGLLTERLKSDSDLAAQSREGRRYAAGVAVGQRRQPQRSHHRGCG